jgi:protease-4
MRFMLISVFVLLASIVCAQDYTITSVAISDDALGVFTNPAALAAGRAPNIGLFCTQRNDELKRFGIAGATPVFGIGYGYWSKGQTRSMFTYSSSFKAGGSVSLGLRGRWMNLVPGDYFTFDAGILARPAKFVSIGAVANSLTKPGIGAVTYPRDYSVGLALRPMTDRVTLFGQWNAVEGEDLDSSRYEVGAELEPIQGFVFKGSIDREMTLKAGLTINFSNSSVGYTATADTVDGLVENGAQVVFSADRNRTVLAGRGGIAEIEIAGRIEDAPSGFSLLGSSSRGLHQVISELRKAREDKTISAVLLNIKGFSAGMGTAYELRREIENLKSGGKKVVAYLEQGGMDLTLYLASAADRIVVSPSSDVILKGPSLEVMMLKGFLDKIGVEADMIKAGKYKSAVEPLTQEKLSPEAREEYQELVDDMFTEIKTAISSGRSLTPEKMDEILKRGAMWPEQAKQLGLIDEAGYYDDAKLAVAKLAGKKADDPDAISTLSIGGRAYRRYSWSEPPKVVVLVASGDIVTGRSRSDILFGTQYMGSETVMDQLASLRRDRSVKAIVLRVDSPGGDGLASDLIWREIEKIRKAGKPIVVSMADLAASGGYFISCNADRIIADPGTITGSIGVFGGKPVFAGTYEKLGINPEVIKSGEYSDAFSPSRKFTDEERKRFQEQIDYFYDDFVAKVADGRKLDKNKVYDLAQGRVYTGTRAKALGLVDEIGTLENAIERAAEMAKIQGKPKVVYIYPKRGLF